LNEIQGIKGRVLRRNPSPALARSKPPQHPTGPHKATPVTSSDSHTPARVSHNPNRERRHFATTCRIQFALPATSDASVSAKPASRGLSAVSAVPIDAVADWFGNCQSAVDMHMEVFNDVVGPAGRYMDTLIVQHGT
jgi:hypothetical protein